MDSEKKTAPNAPRPGRRLRALRVVAVAALASGLAAGTAQALPFAVITTGTIDSGTDNSGVFGAANASLAGLPYTLTISFSGLGSTYFQSATDASTFDPLPGTLTATVGGKTFSAPLGNSVAFGGFIIETKSSLSSFVSGDTSGGQETLLAQNGYQAASNVLPANLNTQFSYAGVAADLADNQRLQRVQFQISGPLGTASFFATPLTLRVAVPEPSSLALATVGLVGFGLVRRRRKHVPGTAPI